jgi:ribosomal protein S18 acetylase RimI-like enzyme
MERDDHTCHLTTKVNEFLRLQKDPAFSAQSIFKQLHAWALFATKWLQEDAKALKNQTASPVPETEKIRNNAHCLIDSVCLTIGEMQCPNHYPPVLLFSKQTHALIGLALFQSQNFGSSMKMFAAIHHFIIDPALQGNGIGRSFAEQLIKDHRQSYDGIVLVAYEQTAKFWQKVGFSRFDPKSIGIDFDCANNNVPMKIEFNN